MGRMLNGKWLVDDAAITNAAGEFARKEVSFRSWITADGAPGPTGTGGFSPQTGRYHLYVAAACPWAHRTLIFRQLKDLKPHISISVVHPDMLEDGWSFATDFPGTTGDDLFGKQFLRDIYLRTDPNFTGRVTVPVLWDKDTGQIVSNESSEIIRMFNSAFNELTGNSTDYWPVELQDEIETVNNRIYNTVNNGVYRAGFANTQAAYDTAVAEVFASLDWLEYRLSQSRYLIGDRLTEADWRLFPTLIRFDAVYHQHFKCNKRRISDYPNLFAYARELYQIKGIAETVDMAQITRHYFYSHRSINPHGIIPTGPETDWLAAHNRG